MAEHENCVGETDEWYTPREYFEPLGLVFDLDPCSPGPGHWVPAKRIYTRTDNGLVLPWRGSVFMNPPYGGRNGHVPWLKKFFDHGNGIAIVRSYTSSGWWHKLMPLAEMLHWPTGKTQFVPSPEHKRKLEARSKDGVFRNAPGHGVVLIGMGEKSCRALEHSGLGLFCRGLIRSECRADERRARAMMGAMLDQERRKVSARLKSPNSIHEGPALPLPRKASARPPKPAKSGSVKGFWRGHFKPTTKSASTSSP